MFQRNISVIITAHSEGIVAHKTVLSVMSRLDKLDNGVKFEVIAALDTPSSETLDYFSRYGNDDIKILKSTFKDPSQNRNHAIQNATGEYIMLIDGDYIISPDLIEKA